MKLITIALSTVFISLNASAADSAAMKPTDAQISSVVMTASQAEVTDAKLAQSKATNKEVKDFAAQMIKDHGKNEKDAQALTKKIGVTPDMNFAQTQELKKSTATKAETMKSLKGAEFDKAYIENQVAMHQSLLNDLNEKFIPAAQNPEFKTFLQTTKGHIEAHLTHAKDLQAKMTK